MRELVWKAAMPIIIAALEDGTPTGKAMARAELADLAAKLDALNREPADDALTLQLEGVACMWEEVCGDSSESAPWTPYREAQGAVALRHCVISLVDSLLATYDALDEESRDALGAYDWGFAPLFIRINHEKGPAIIYSPMIGSAFNPPRQPIEPRYPMR